MKRIKMAVVGVGALGRHHARILSQLDQVELVAVVDPRSEVGRPIAESTGSRWLQSPDQLDGLIDAVSIVVPTVAHEAVALPFLRAGVPVLVEKPLASTVTEAQAIAEAAEQYGTLLQVGHIERFNPATAAARPVVGTPRYIRAERTSAYTFRSTDIGVTHDLMIHDLDLILDLAQSSVCDVDAFGISIFGGHEDTVHARLKFENGCVADLTASRVCPVARRSMQIWSDAACTTIDMADRQVVSYRLSDAARFGTPVYLRAAEPGADVESLKADVFGRFIRIDNVPVPEQDALTAELASFVECVQTGSRPLVGGAEGLAAMQVAELILQSVQSHHWGPAMPGSIPSVGRPGGLRKAG